MFIYQLRTMLVWVLFNQKTILETVSPVVSPFEKLNQKNRVGLLKTPEIWALARVESSLLKGARKYCEENGFTEIMVPHMTKATGACENIATMFEIDYFGQRGYMSQTGQLYLEVLTPFLKKVWFIIHSFRAEPDVDDRHLTEFPLIEIEFEGDMKQLMEHVQNLIYSMVKQVIVERKEEIDFFGIDKKYLEKFKPPYKRITYTWAIEHLGDGFKLNWGDDIRSKHERYLSALMGMEPFFLTHWPKVIKFFNMRENDENPKIVNSCDLILPLSGEAVGGAEREYRHEKLKERLLQSTMLKMLMERGGDIKDFEWYLNFYKEKNVGLHSGCGVGFNRVTQSVLGINDIRACTVFPMNRENIL